MKPKRLLSVASATDLPAFEIAAGDWLRIESVYGQKIAPPLRRQIEDRTRHFLEWATYERNAPPAINADKLARALDTSGAKVATALRDLLGSGDAARYVRHLIEKQLPKVDGQSALRTVCKQVEAMNLACLAAKRELADQAGFQPGTAWKSWVLGVAVSLDQHGHEWGVRKDDLGRGPSPSPIVVLIREIQKLIPVAYRRHHRSDGSLAQNISKATRSLRKKKHQGVRLTCRAGTMPVRSTI
jgi:hypothetical protein